MDLHFTIRPLDNDHSQQIIDPVLPIQQKEFHVPVTLEGQPDLLDIESSYFLNGGCFWGAIMDGQLIGTIALISNGHQSGTIRKIFVKKEYRWKEFGVGQRLFDVLLEYCLHKNIVKLYLGTRDSLEAAKRFYERNGFRKISKADLPDYFPVMEVDNVFYFLHVNRISPQN